MRLLCFLSLFLLLSALNLSADEIEKRLLIIGNSYTFYNKLPDIIQAMADASHTPLKVDSYTVGAMSLRGFLNTPAHQRCRTMLAEGDYDWVLLQDQSQTPAQRPTETLNSVREWSQLAAKHNTQVVLFLTWAHAAQNVKTITLQEAMQNDTSRTYCQAAIQNNALVAPAGEAWRQWYEKHPKHPLHINDLSHPTPEGSYLAACVIFSTITGKPAASLPSNLRNTGLRISNARTRELQKIADQTIKNFTPEKFLKQIKNSDSKRPTPDDIPAILSKGMKVSDLTKKIGKPHLVQKSGKQLIYQYRLQRQAELVAYCNSRGIIQQISIAGPGVPVEIIDLNQLEKRKN